MIPAFRASQDNERFAIKKPASTVDDRSRSTPTPTARLAVPEAACWLPVPALQHLAALRAVPFAEVDRIVTSLRAIAAAPVRQRQKRFAASLTDHFDFGRTLS